MRTDVPAQAPRIALLALVVVLVALAGCSSGGDPTTTGPEVDPDANTPVVTTTDSGGTPTGGETTADGSPATTDTAPATTTDAGSISREIAGNHVVALAREGTFTTRMTVNVSAVREGQRMNTTLNRTIYANQSAGRSLLIQALVNDAGTSVTRTSYTADNATYQRARSSRIGTQYAYASAPYDGNVRPVGFGFARGEGFVSAEIDWTEAGRTTVDGTAVTTYTASGLDDFGFDPQQFSNQQLEEVASVNGTVYVADSGVVRRMEISLVATDASGNRYSQFQSMAFIDVGSTDVPEPGWLSEARNASEG